MLSIERKKTEKVDLVKPLVGYIKTQYSEKVANDHNEVLNNLQQLREDIRNSQDKSDTVKELLLKYYTILNSLELRFPVSEDNVRISFQWTDVFKNKKISTYSVFFERACVLFNYATILGQLGAVQNRNGADGLKLAANYFQAAAGAYNDLKEYSSRHPECSTSSDLTSEGLAMLCNLMLAQAQACYVEKAGRDNMKDGIVAKLAEQAVEYYETAVGLLNGSLKSIVDRSWSGNVEAWTFMHKAISQYRMSQVANEAMRYGEQVARVVVADNHINEAKKRLTRTAAPELKENIERLSAVITRARQIAEKENNSIYNETVPPESRLESIEKKTLVKPTPIPDYNVTDPFSALVPFTIKEAAAKYREMRDNMIRKELQNLEDHNEIAKSSLSSMNLPGAIEALETPVGLPPALLEKMAVVSSDGGPAYLTELMETLRRLTEEDFSVLRGCTSSLDKEEEEDNKLRAAHGSRWQRTPSHTLTASLRQEANKYNGYLEHATKSDNLLRSKWQEHQQGITLLHGSKDEILARLPSSNASSLVDTSGLKKALSELDSLIASREGSKGEFSGLTAKDDISLKLLGAPSHDEVFAEELRKYDVILNRLRDNYIRQDELLNIIQEENVTFTSALRKQQGGAGNQRDAMLTSLNNAYKAYNEIKSGLREGIQFYLNLQEILNQYKSKCEDFIQAREVEKEDLLVQINLPQPPPGAIPGALPGSWPASLPPPLYAPQLPPPYPYGQPPPYASAPPPPYGYAPAQYPPQTQRR